VPGVTLLTVSGIFPFTFSKGVTALELPLESVVVFVPSEQETKKTTRQQNKKLFMINDFTNDIILFSKPAPINE
jgi:hypothetical protein